MSLHLGSLGLLLVTVLQSAAVPPKTVRVFKRTIEYNRDVRPILSKCFTCHGHDAKELKAGLKLDDRAGAMTVLSDGLQAVVPYHPEQSELIARVKSHGSGIMPPKSSNKVLVPEEIATLERWIVEGAEYKPHWAFVAPVRPAIPSVKQAAWVKNDIDAFILATLESKGLHPSAEADRNTLIRRVSLDLTGLPPTPVEIEAFVKDKSPQAYEKVVDRLLSSPRYAERMAMDWMDYSRYADSNGFQSDWERFQWRWRDWVLDAFNKDMPYDQFTIEQLAGDLLPHPTANQVIATGFNRNHRINTEGGVVPEEWRIEGVIDRAETTSQVWLGLTSGCARCHDHKYDPIKQKDFYSLCAYFNNVPESGTGAEMPVNHPPLLMAPTKDQALQISQLQLQEKSIKAVMTPKIAEAVAASSTWKPDDLTAKTFSSGVVAQYKIAAGLSSASASTPIPKVSGEVKFGPGSGLGAVTVGEKGFVDLGDIASFEKTDRFSYGAWVNPSMENGAVLSKMDESKDFIGWDFYLTGRKPSVHLLHKWPDDALKVVSKVELPLHQWSHIFATYDGSGKPSGVHLFVNGADTPTETEVDKLQGSIKNNVSVRLGRRHDNSVFNGQIESPLIFSRELSATEVNALMLADSSRLISAIEPSKRTSEQQRILSRTWLLSHDAEFKTLDLKLQGLERDRGEIESKVTSVMVMQEMPKPRPAFVLIRGQYDHPGQRVTANVPEFLKLKGKTFAKNRLGLAQWIVDPQNPLTSRVTVNRLWERLFGTGIVATSEDFGTRAEYPSHPELLDYLATELVRLKWHLKPMLKELVMSATYRQSSNARLDAEKIDPANRLLARGPRFRLPGEVIRDQAMYFGGLLTEKMGGPSVRPYQPDGIWDETSVYGNLHNYKHDMGANLHRRSLYTIWKRTATPPNMTLFDVPTREVCRVQRARTDTPLQALDLMNDVAYLEAARALAQRMLAQPRMTTVERLSYGFQTVLGRKPNDQELKILSAGLQRSQNHYQKDALAAKEISSIGVFKMDQSSDPARVAAYTLSASTLLNLDETLTKE